jgi:AcrR family transcriptional regulator
MIVNEETKPAVSDRRVRKTRRQLQRALVDLVADHPYEDLTIEAITERADVARATFYSHYKDKDTLLESVAAQLIEDLLGELMPVASTDDRIHGEAVVGLYRHAEANRHLYRTLLAGAGDGRPLRQVADVLATAMTTNFQSRVDHFAATPRVPLPIMARAWVGSHLSLVSWWLDSSGQYSAQDMALMQLRIDVHGLRWGHGLQSDEVRLDEDAVLAVVAPGARHPSDARA